MCLWDVLSSKMKKLEKEKNWNGLPFEMKEKVVKEMDFETRTRLKKCSKSDKKLVESTPILYDELYISVLNNGSEYLDAILAIHSKLRVFLEIKITVKKSEVDGDRSSHSMEIFSRSNRVEKHTKRIRCSSEEDGKKFVENVIRSVLFDGNLRFNKASIWINVPGFLENTDFTIHTKHFTINDVDRQSIEWMNKLAPKVESVTLPAKVWNRDDVVNGVGAFPVVMNAQKIEIGHQCDINDEQLLNLQCTFLEIDRSNITKKGINELIKKAIANDYPINTLFVISLKDDCVLNDIWKEISEELHVERIALNCDEVGCGRQREETHGIIRMGQNKKMIVHVYPGTFKAEID